ncbi:MAG TPA: S41 family peptidase [Gemmataceae bacterium]|nr:S41 family peptidase [Gemmataceae bacterium]
MTQAMLTRWLGAVLALGLLALPLCADQPKDDADKTSHPYVVLVGISNYADKQIKPRPHAEDDAKALFELFTSKKYLGADAEHSRLLLGDSAKAPGSQPATRDNILKAVHWIAENAKSNDLVVFGFFGEGGPLGDSGAHRCYFASDSTFAGRDKDALAALEIGEALKDLKSRRFCVLLDVNFKGFTTTDKKVAEATLGTNPYKEFLGTDDNEEELAKPGRALFLANDGLKRSLDLKDHGIFAEAVLKGLEGAADKDGYEPDGLVTVDELREYLDKDGRDLIRAHAQTKEEREQYFLPLSGGGNHYVLTHNPAVADKVKEQENEFASMLGRGKVPQKYGDEGKTLLERMPRLEAQRKLRKKYQALLQGKIDTEKFIDQRKEIVESTKLLRADAENFAEKVMDAINTITRGYVKELDRHDMVVWAIKGLYRQVDVTGTTPVLYPNKLPENIAARLKDVADMKQDELKDLLADARQAVGKREDLDKHKDIDWTLKRMLYKHADPYTTYIDKEEKERMSRQIRGRFPGVGIQIRKDSATDQLLVVTPIKGSPAYRAGIQAGDLITTVTRAVDSEGEPLSPPEVLPTKGMKLNDAVDKITGKPGTKVRLTVQREGAAKPIDFDLTRGFVNVESVLGFKRKSDDSWDYLIDPQNKIAYIRLTEFQRNSTRDMYKVMHDLTESGIKGFIFDLRFDPGGLLDVAVDISDLFIDDGVIVSIRERNRPEKEITGNSRGSLLDFPMVCLVNGYSASGSEIVSACLQDHDRAYIIGERSYGKGSVQHILDFDGGEIKLTVATFWRPSKKNLNKSSTSGKEEDEWGVVPNKVIKLTAKERADLDEHMHTTEIIQRKDKPAEVKKFEDKQLDEALKYLRGQIRTASRTGLKKAG